MQPEDAATSRSLAFSKPDCALDRFGKVLDPSRRTGLSAAFTCITDKSATFNSAAPSVGCAGDIQSCDIYFESYRDEMMFERNSRSCYSGFSGISAKAFETLDLIEPTLSRKLGYGRNAGG
jgi:hypothetical protein